MKIRLFKPKTWYWLHKWTSIFTGVALVMWLITGLVINWDRLFPPAETALPAVPVYASLEMSPAAAIDRLEELTGQSVEVQSVNLRRLPEMVVYEISRRDGPTALLDAQTGQLVEITSELAETIALADRPQAGAVQAVDQLAYNDQGYVYGPLPVYRVVLADGKDTYVHVTADTGEISQVNDRWSRGRYYLRTLHNFQAVKLFSNRQAVITSLLWGTTIATLVTVVLGYYLALPRKWRIF